MNHIITESSIGKAWVASVAKVMQEGASAKDGDTLLKEFLNLQIIIDAPAAENDSIVESYGKKEMLEWMKKNFLSMDNVDNWGYSYGQRIFCYDNFDQFEHVKNKLLKNPEAKSATLTLSNPPQDLKHAPCINIIDFKIRNGMLMMNTFFRSQDIFKKMYADAICLTIIMDKLASELQIHKKLLNLYIMSAHIYENDFQNSQKLMDELIGDLI